MEEERLLSLEEAAEFLGIHPNTLRQWLRAGKIRASKVGRLWRIKRSALEEFLKERELKLNGKGENRSGGA